MLGNKLHNSHLNFKRTSYSGNNILGMSKLEDDFMLITSKENTFAHNVTMSDAFISMVYYILSLTFRFGKPTALLEALECCSPTAAMLL